MSIYKKSHPIILAFRTGNINFTKFYGALNFLGLQYHGSSKETLGPGTSSFTDGLFGVFFSRGSILYSLNCGAIPVFCVTVNNRVT